MRALQKIVVLLIVALPAQAPASEEPVVVEQKRPLIYTTPDASGVARSADSEANIDFEVIKTHTAGWKRLLVNLGLAHPFFQVKLSLPANRGEAPVQEARWEFPAAYYFPKDARDIEGADVLVNVWRSFPVTARVKFADGSEKTVTKWIDPEAELAQR